MGCDRCFVSPLTCSTLLPATMSSRDRFTDDSSQIALLRVSRQAPPPTRFAMATASAGSDLSVLPLLKHLGKACIADRDNRLIFDRLRMLRRFRPTQNTIFHPPLALSAAVYYSIHPPHPFPARPSPFQGSLYAGMISSLPLISSTKGALVISRCRCLLIHNYLASHRRTRCTFLISFVLLPPSFMQRGSV